MNAADLILERYRRLSTLAREMEQEAIRTLVFSVADLAEEREDDDLVGLTRVARGLLVELSAGFGDEGQYYGALAQLADIIDGIIAGMEGL